MTLRLRLAVAALACALVAGICALTIDAPLARALYGSAPWAGWNAIQVVIEYATGFDPWPWAPIIGFAAAFAVCVGYRPWRRALPSWCFVAGTYFLTMNLLGWVKLVAGRTRPHQWLAHHHATARWLSTGDSFPSGHVALIGALCVSMLVVAPRVGRVLMVMLAFTMIERVVVEAHHVSDTIGALALVCACAAIWEPVLRRFGRSTANVRPAGSPAGG